MINIINRAIDLKLLYIDHNNLIARNLFIPSPPPEYPQVDTWNIFNISKHLLEYSVLIDQHKTTYTPLTVDIVHRYFCTRISSINTQIIISLLILTTDGIILKNGIICANKNPVDNIQKAKLLYKLFYEIQDPIHRNVLQYRIDKIQDI